MSFQKAIVRYLERAVERYGIPGLDLSIFRRHQEVFRCRMGYADVENRRPITEKTLYNIYSNTKVITCTAALQLYEQGEFLLEDPLHLFFPEFAHMKVRQPDGSLTDAKNPITVRDLFRMTAGIGDGRDYRDVGERFYAGTGGACSVSALPQYLAQEPLLFEPGTQYCYGICHEMLAALIEKISGETFGQYLQRHIFRPLGMERTAFSTDEEMRGDLAVQYRYMGEGQSLKNEGPMNILIPPILKESASGGLISSVDDYMKFQEALCRGDVLLSRRTTDLMRLDQLSGSMRDGYGYTGIGMGYGLGVRTIIDQAGCGSPVGFGPYGWGGAAGTYGSIDPENELTFFYAQHYFGPDDLRLHNGLRNVIYSHLPE